jgi:hypothetical protein
MTRGECGTHLRIHATQCARVLQDRSHPSEIRGRREDRVHAAPAVSCATCTKKRTRAYRFSGGIPAFPAQWFYGLLRALPGDRAFLPPSSLRSVCFSKNLTPASGRQNHTTSPYATVPFVCTLARAQHLRVHRIPPYVRDDHDTPLLMRRDGQACSDDLPDGERGMFLPRGLDHPNHVEIAGLIRLIKHGVGAPLTDFVRIEFVVKRSDGCRRFIRHDAAALTIGHGHRVVISFTTQPVNVR